ncbi:hypothetical protein CFOL_v3_31514, partial [Cephalotus follicularis]
VMSMASRDLVASEDNNKVGPDFFGYYRHEIVELLSQDEDLLTSTSDASGLSICNGAGSLFNCSLGAGLSDFKKERLKTLLRQAVIALTPEVAEMLNPVVSMINLRSQLRRKGTGSDCDAGQVPQKKFKVSSSSSSISIPVNASPVNCKSIRGADDDLQFLLDNDRLQVEETIKKYSNQLSGTLSHMEQQLEEILDVVVSKWRPMSRCEKQQLQKLIQDLPPKNLDRVLQIVGRSKRAETQSSDQFFVDLDKEDNLTLWRLYYYVKAVEKARKLSS